MGTTRALEEENAQAGEEKTKAGSCQEEESHAEATKDVNTGVRKQTNKHKR